MIVMIFKYILILSNLNIKIIYKFEKKTFLKSNIILRNRKMPLSIFEIVAKLF